MRRICYEGSSGLIHPAIPMRGLLWWRHLCSICESTSVCHQKDYVLPPCMYISKICNAACCAHHLYPLWSIEIGFLQLVSAQSRRPCLENKMCFSPQKGFFWKQPTSSTSTPTPAKASCNCAEVFWQGASIIPNYHCTAFKTNGWCYITCKCTGLS